MASMSVELSVSLNISRSIQSTSETAGSDKILDSASGESRTAARGIGDCGSPNSNHSLSSSRSRFVFFRRDFATGMVIVFGLLNDHRLRLDELGRGASNRLYAKDASSAKVLEKIYLFFTMGI